MPASRDGGRSIYIDPAMEYKGNIPSDTPVNNQRATYDGTEAEKVPKKKSRIYSKKGEQGKDPTEKLKSTDRLRSIPKIELTNLQNLPDGVRPVTPLDPSFTSGQMPARTPRSSPKLNLETSGSGSNSPGEFMPRTPHSSGTPRNPVRRDSLLRGNYRKPLVNVTHPPATLSDPEKFKRASQVFLRKANGPLLDAKKTEEELLADKIRGALTKVMEKSGTHQPSLLPAGEMGQFIAAIQECEADPQKLGELLQQMDTGSSQWVVFLMIRKVFLYLQPATCRLLIDHVVHLSKDGQTDELLILAAEMETLLDTALIADKMRCALTKVMEKSKIIYQPRRLPADSEVGQFVAAVQECEASRSVDPQKLSELLQKLGYTNSAHLFDFLLNSRVFLYLQPATCSLLIDHAVHLSQDGQISESFVLAAEKKALHAAETESKMAARDERYVVQMTMRCALTEVMEKSETYRPRMLPMGSPVGQFVAAIREHEASGVDPQELSKLLQKLGYTNSLHLFDFLIYSKAFSYLQPATCSLLIDYAVHLSKDGKIKNETVILRSLARRVADDRDDVSFESLNPEPPPLTGEQQEELLRKAYLSVPPIKLEFDYDGGDRSKVSARTALHWRWQEYQYIDPPVQPPRRPQDPPPVDPPYDFAQGLIKHDSKGRVRKPTQDEIKRAFRVCGYRVPTQAVNFLMKNPTIFSYFGPDTNELLIDVALTIEPSIIVEPSIIERKQRIERTIGVNMLRLMSKMCEVRLVRRIDPKDPQQDVALELAKAVPEIGKPPKLSRQQREVLQQYGLTNAKSMFKFLIESPVFAVCDKATCELLMKHASELQDRDGSVRESDIDKAEAVANTLSANAARILGVDVWPPQSKVESASLSQ